MYISIYKYKSSLNKYINNDNNFMTLKTKIYQNINILDEELKKIYFKINLLCIQCLHLIFDYDDLFQYNHFHFHRNIQL
jgi:hypothetical protein